jgi:NitT/TauT family transport system permease protein
MSAIAVERSSKARIDALPRALARGLLLIVGFGALWGAWEGYRWHYALFTGKEALAGFALGAVIGFLLAVVLAHSTVLRRGFLPYIVVSQTVPILAIAPMVVVGLGTKGVEPWVAVAVIAAYLTFFPVAINTLRGLHSPDPRAVELVRSYAAGRWKVLWRLRVPASLPYVFSALKISATASVIGAIIGETPASLQGGLGYAIVNFNQYYTGNRPRSRAR